MHIIYTDHHRLHNAHEIRVEGEPFENEEVPERVEAILEAVRTARLGPVEAPEDHGMEPLLAVHDPGFLDYLRGAYAAGCELAGQGGPVFPETYATRQIRHKTRHPVGLRGYYCNGTGTPILEGTWTAAYWSAQCALAAAGRVRQGERAAYALCRPPGHHAAAGLYGGFCFLNNAAIAARSLGERTAILDIDYHHGNGTQEIFYADPSVLFCSLHADPDEDYPYFWGTAAERGEGPGEGFNHNWPLPQGVGDEDYQRSLAEALEVIAGFAPRYLVVSAGFDTLAGDPVGGFRLTTHGLRRTGQEIAGLGIPSVIVQEGGYLMSKLGESAVAFLESFA